MIFYLTFNEAPSGIFSSQVVDVVKFMNANFNVKVRLLAFISLRGYALNKKKIKQEMPDAIVLPMFPKMQNWAKNKFLMNSFCSVYKPEKIIARSVMATKLALLIRDKKRSVKVIYDGRGAISAEWREYNVVNDAVLLNAITSYEKEVIHASDYRIAVSDQLIELWRDKYAYNDNKHVIIPCTLNSDFEKINISIEKVSEKREELTIDENDTVFVYSGSIAGWQSFDLLFSFIEPVLKKDKTNKIIFFSSSDPNIDKLKKMFPQQVIQKHLPSNKVSDYLFIGDYGLLIRERSDTNKVASPLKYAEYLASGLKVIISEELGDYTKLSLEKNWGTIYTQFNLNEQKPDLKTKQKISEESIRLFSKQHYKEEYNRLISF